MKCWETTPQRVRPPLGPTHFSLLRPPGPSDPTSREPPVRFDSTRSDLPTPPLLPSDHSVPPVTDEDEGDPLPLTFSVRETGRPGHSRPKGENRSVETLVDPKPREWD